MENLVNIGKPVQIFGAYFISGMGGEVTTPPTLPLDPTLFTLQFLIYKLNNTNGLRYHGFSIASFSSLLLHDANPEQMSL